MQPAGNVAKSLEACVTGVINKMSHIHFLYHVVFGTKDRMSLIKTEWENELHAYLGGIIKNHEGIPIEINGIADHAHLLVRLPQTCKFPEFMRELKASSSGWVRKNHFGKFSWQSRYGAFTVSESQVERVRTYIRNQKQHHRKQDFETEYKALLNAHKIEFDDKTIWN